MYQHLDAHRRVIETGQHVVYCGVYGHDQSIMGLVTYTCHSHFIVRWSKGSDDWCEWFTAVGAHSNTQIRILEGAELTWRTLKHS